MFRRHLIDLLSQEPRSISSLARELGASRSDLAPALKNEASAVVGGSSHFRLRKGLVVAQVALSLLLLIGAGLFTRSLMNLRALDPGFKPDRLFAFDVDPARSGQDFTQRVATLRRIQEQLERTGRIDPDFSLPVFAGEEGDLRKGSPFSMDRQRLPEKVRRLDIVHAVELKKKRPSRPIARAVHRGSEGGKIVLWLAELEGGGLGLLSKQGRLWAWNEGSRDDVLPLIPDKYFERAVMAAGGGASTSPNGGDSDS